ncbi:tetratricopeptide repeat protein [Streptomyces sp. NPDC020965]|uniref:tetratricopeptide repeat protein n=1 Tax=Streptomyces sp. NPDC020965 TaxID=3365105 RepID=UPI0037900C8D
MGHSLKDAGLYTVAIAHWLDVATRSEHLFGTKHPDTLITRLNLALSYWRAGRTQEAITLQEQVLADCERILGPDHPDTASADRALVIWRAEPDSVAEV